MRLRAASTAVLTAVLLSLTACATDEPEATDPTGTSETTESTESAGSTESTESTDPAEPGETAKPSENAAQTIEITIEGHHVSPSGERVEVGVGEPIELVVTADAAGELHVHSTPEQELAYGAGTTVLPLTLDRPGIVEVESHDAHQVIVQLQVQ